jgi:hypothetical protein
MTMRCRIAVLVMLWGGGALAQSVHPARDPADVKAQVPPAQYTSPFAGYRPFKDERVGDWKNANEVVGTIGGWKVYAREASQADIKAIPDASKAAPAPAVPTAKPVHGH